MKGSALLKRIVDRVLAWFDWRAPVPVIIDAVNENTAPASATPAIVISRPPAEKSDEGYGRFHFKGAILDQLPAYFKYIRRMQRVDPDAYDLFSQIGAHVIPNAIGCLSNGASPWFRAGNRPTFGCHALSYDEEAEHKGLVSPKFAYFQKLRRWRAGIVPQPVHLNHVIYEVTVYFDDRHDRKLFLKSGIPITFFVGVSPEGRVTVLKERISVKVDDWRENRWRNSPGMDGWAKENGRSVQDIGEGVFFAIISSVEAGDSGLRITARKGECAATFALDMDRTAYFFKDRDVTINDKGSRRKIFHIVRTHKRIGAGGREHFVRSHFRGESKFVWNGYEVLITLPGKHHAALSDAQFEARRYEGKKKRGDLSMRQAGKMMADHFSGSLH